MAYSIGCKTFKRALIGWIATTSFVSFAALAQYELPPVEVVGKPMPEWPSDPGRPESHEWNWFNPVPRPSFDPQVAIVSNRKRDDCGGNPVDRFSGSKIEPETDFVSAGDMGLTLTGGAQAMARANTSGDFRRILGSAISERLADSTVA